MIKLCKIGKWYSIEQIAEFQKEVDAQQELIERGQEYIEDEIEELEDEIRSKKRAIESLDDENFSTPSDVETLTEKGYDMVRWYADPTDRSVRGTLIPHLEYADSKRKIFVRKFERGSKPFESIPIEEPLESAPA